MKNLPIGIQTLVEIRAKNGIYVDKTEIIHKMISTGKYYFLSRPRRFGKSLTVSTIKELFLANRSIFENLWIYDKWDWSKTNPVLHFSFDAINYRRQSLDLSLSKEIKYWAKEYNIRLVETDFQDQFRELIEKLAKKKGKVVLLIDEYDKPIIDFLEQSEIDQAKVNRSILRDFFSVLKNADTSLELVFITGISKFAKISLFSHLNNLTDITLSKEYGAITGYTQAELNLNFDDYLKRCAKELSISNDDLIKVMKKWYDGYTWDGETEMYNPFGTLKFLANRQFNNYWFSSGSPQFLIEQMRKFKRFDVENSVVNNTLLDKYDIENIELIPLLFQTGYLTIKSVDPLTGDMVMDYPNKEVRESIYQFLIDDLAKNPYRTHTGHTIQDLNQAFLTNDISKVKNILNSLLADLPDHTFEKQREGLYHGLIHIVFSYLGMFAQSEVHSSEGRADAVVQTPTHIYIFEFKFNKTAQEALDQIKDKKHADKYLLSNKKLSGIGINFNADLKRIDDWLIEELTVVTN